MPKFFVKENQIKDNIITILGQDVNHIKNVLREKVGNEINICEIEQEQDYLCEITKIENEKIECKIKQKLSSTTESNIKVSIFQGLPKADKMELIIQKSVELGAYDIIPTKMKRCVVKLKDKDANKKIQRWQKISETATKQCGRSHIPKIQDISSIENICQQTKNYDIVIVAYEKEKNNTLKKELKKLKEQEKIKIAIVIGPEGGIEEEEIRKLQESGSKIVTLGNRILRTETVALSMLSSIMYELEN